MVGHGIIWWIIVGLIAGFLTGKIMKGGGYGAIMDIIIGIVGALIGGFIMSHLFGASSSGGLIYTILVAILGAVILTWLLRLITGSRTSSFNRQLRAGDGLRLMRLSPSLFAPQARVFRQDSRWPAILEGADGAPSSLVRSGVFA